MSAAIALDNPKFAMNVGSAVRVAAAYAIDTVFYSGSRIEFDERLPRELRHKDYRDVKVQHIAGLPTGYVPVCVEIVDGAQDLTTFEHPKDALYLFGPEDGSVSQWWRRGSHFFVQIPTMFCLNLATAVATVMYDRYVKEQHVQ